VLGREVEEGEQLGFVSAERGHGLRVLGPVVALEPVDRSLCRLARLGPHDLVERRLGLRMKSFRELVEHVGDPVHPAPLLARLGPYVAQRLPEPERTVAHG
jgi:hypothetical protein